MSTETREIINEANATIKKNREIVNAIAQKSNTIESSKTIIAKAEANLKAAKNALAQKNKATANSTEAARKAAAEAEAKRIANAEAAAEAARKAAAEEAARKAAEEAARKAAAEEAARKAAVDTAARQAAEEATAAAAGAKAAIAKAAIEAENAEFSKMKPVTLKYQLGIKIKQLENYKKFKNPNFNQTKLNRYTKKLASLNTTKGGYRYRSIPRQITRRSRRTHRVRTQRLRTQRK